MNKRSLYVMITGIHQLFSQGTADMILDSCTDYWDGSDIRPLSEADRSVSGEEYVVYCTKCISYLMNDNSYQCIINICSCIYMW